MKKLARICILLLCSTGVAFAQQVNHQEVPAVEQAALMMEHLQNELILSEEQELEARQTWEEFFDEMEEVKQQMADKKTIRQLQQTRDVKMKGVLDETQYDTYQHLLKKCRRDKKNGFSVAI